MSIKLDEYFDPETFSRIRARADQLETPFLVVDLKTIDRAYDELVEGFPFGKIYYAVKANPSNEVLGLLKNQGRQLRHRFYL
jgi:ornithine decarboxylase